MTQCRSYARQGWHIPSWIDGWGRLVCNVKCAVCSLECAVLIAERILQSSECRMQRAKRRVQDVAHSQKTYPIHERHSVTEYHLFIQHNYGHNTRCFKTRVATRPLLWQRDLSCALLIRQHTERWTHLRITKIWLGVQAVQARYCRQKCKSSTLDPFRIGVH